MSGGGSGPVVTEQENDLAQTALSGFYHNPPKLAAYLILPFLDALEFIEAHYAECSATLHKLEQIWKHDYKVMHNKAVADFYRSDLKKSDQFIKDLNNLREEQPMINDECVNLDDVDHCALYYNHAVVLFHQRKFNLALKIVQKVFAFIEPMEESLAHKVCLLLLELLIILRRVDEALERIYYIMMQFASTKNIQGLEKEPSEKKPVIFDAETDAFRLKLLQYQTRCYLLKGSIRASQRELETILTTGGENTIATIFLQANVEYLKRNYEKSIEYLKSASKISGDTNALLPILFYNNLGCIHHQMGKRQLSAFYFKKGLVEMENLNKNTSRGVDRPLFTYHHSAQSELMYNTGVALLFAGNPSSAFDFLLQAVQVYHMNPRLWLRMAECCIMVHKKSNEDDFSMHSRKKYLLKKRIGSGYHRKLILTKKVSENDAKSVCEQSYAIPAPTLEFASLCLKNALLLLPPNVEGERRDFLTTPANTTNATPVGPKNLSSSKSGPGVTNHAPDTRTSMFGAPSALMRDAEARRLRVSVLAASAYVSLCLGDYTLTLEYATELLHQDSKHVSGAMNMLGHLYAAEALIHLDRTAQALENLQLEFILDIDTSSASSLQELEDGIEGRLTNKVDWFPRNLLTANIIMQYNLAAAHAIRGELDAAADMLKCLWLLKNQCELPIQIVMLTLYVEIRLGIAETSSFIRQYCPHLLT